MPLRKQNDGRQQALGLIEEALKLLDIHGPVIAANTLSLAAETLRTKITHDPA